MKKITSIIAALALLLTLSFPIVSTATEEITILPYEEGMSFPNFILEDDNIRYYESEENYNGHLPAIGKYQIADSTYYFDEEGNLFKDGWKEIEGKKYYFSKKDGHMVRGWLSSTYYLDENGHMVTGWKTIKENKYYFSKTTGKKFTGLHKIGKGKKAVVCTFSKKGVLERKLYASKKSICLTFDDGPASSTTRVLKTLDAYNAKATFFMVGNRCSSYKKTCKLVAQKGHQIACHTYSHAWLCDLSASGIRNEMTKGKNTIIKYTGVTPTVCRTPGGQNTSTIRNNVGMPIILWSVDTRDWEHHDPAQTLSAVKRGARDGAIVLMHDLHSTTADAVPSVCKYLKKKGYQMVTVKEMALLKGKTLKAGKVYYSF